MPGSRPPFGRLLRQWRDLRGLSQLALDIPLRERNALLAAAGFASAYAESDLDAPEMAMLRRVVDFVLEWHAPYPAILVDRAWNLLAANASAPRLFARFAGAREPWTRQPLNLLRLTLHPQALQPYVVNFDEVATELLTGLHRRVSVPGAAPELDALLAELTSLPGIPAAGVVPDLSRRPNPALPLHLKRDDLELRMCTVVTQSRRRRTSRSGSFPTSSASSGPCSWSGETPMRTCPSPLRAGWKRMSPASSAS